ncbi:uncharacterized protein RCC_10788 [Ramularia collo-cygni]|uniref:Uncharacterized protein n=1 Tax=Ramularia collo-cygni TaxID=112498 RepID=A0A2D3VDA4_9PEZI|nr:uncharacterized protein RCC_10788 [Ramularia collo-cygni]CZT25060.1 uncharacterized protein RCC_10788 [Ramularia collo-cygni]
MLRRGGVDQARAKLRQEEAINTGESELKQRNAKRPRTEISNYQGVLNDIPGASLEELRNIKQRYLMYSGEVLDPDVDVWIPDNPSSSCLGLTRSTISERRKSYWEAQCYFRGLPTQGHLIILQGRLRDRAEVVERSIAEKIDMCERVLDAEWLLEHPRTRFNVRAVRKARKIMLYPEENAIARGWLSSRDIRPATLARLRPRQASFAESDGGT